MTPDEIIAGLRQVQEALSPFELGKAMPCLHMKGTKAVLLQTWQQDQLCGVASRLPALIAAVEAHEQLLNTVLIAWGRHLGGWDESKATPEDMEAYKYLHGEVTGHDTAAAKAHRCPTVKLDHIATSEESNSYICPECMRVYLVKNGDGQ